MVEMADDTVCQLLPTFTLVAVGLSTTDSEHCIQKQYPLLRPFDEIWVGVFNAKIRLYLFENVDKRWGSVCAGQYGETHAMGLVWAVIRVLPDDDNFDIFKSSAFERTENVVHIRINHVL